MKILLAINDNDKYYRLKKEISKKIKHAIFYDNIIYREGIIEFLYMQTDDIEKIIFDERLDGNKDIFNLIKEILEMNKNLEIIYLIENREEEKENFLRSYGINKIIDVSKTEKEICEILLGNNCCLQEEINIKIEEIRDKVFDEKLQKGIKKTSKIEKSQGISRKNNVLKKIFKKENIDENKKKITNTSKEKPPDIIIGVSENIKKYSVQGIDVIVKFKK